MEAVTATMSENIFGCRAKEEERYKLQLTRKECLQMHDTKRCKWHPLKCIEGNCHYKGINQKKFIIIGLATTKQAIIVS
jgi:hypothetical protein